MTGKKANPASAPRRRRAVEVTGSAGKNTLALRIAASMGLLTGPKTKHFNAKVSPKLFEAAAKQAGTTSPAAVIDAALAALATEDELGPWLAKNWGVLADTPPELIDQIEL
jgi:hypothetical protein